MKVAFLVLGLVFLSSLGAEEYSVFEGRAHTHNPALRRLTSREYAIRHEDGTDNFYLHTRDFMGPQWVHLSPEHLSTIREAIEKFLEWEQIAVENEVTMERAIPDASIDTQVTWQFGSDWYNGTGLTLSFTFFSQSETRHQLVMHTNEVESSNPFITYQLKGLYLDRDQAESLYRGIRPSSIQAVQDERADARAKVDELFE